MLADAAGRDLSEVYAYDEIYRLIGTDRGRFVSGVFQKASDFQDWTLDGMGNFPRVAKLNQDESRPGRLAPNQ